MKKVISSLLVMSMVFCASVSKADNLTVEQAKARAAYAGLYLQSRGTTSSSGSVSVSSQDIEPGTEVARGTTITVKFTDSSALD